MDKLPHDVTEKIREDYLNLSTSSSQNRANFEFNKPCSSLDTKDQRNICVIAFTYAIKSIFDRICTVGTDEDGNQLWFDKYHDELDYAGSFLITEKGHFADFKSLVFNCV